MLDWFKDLFSRVSERARSPLYSVFTLSWITCNWKFFYVTFFESYESLGKAKIEYIYYNIYSDPLWALVKLIILPCISTYLIIWKLPLLAKQAFDTTELFKEERKISKREIIKQKGVSGELYVRLLDEYKKQHDDFADSINNINAIEAQKMILEHDIIDLKNDLSEAKKESITNQKTIDEINERLGFVAKENDLLKDNILRTTHSAEDFFRGNWVNYFEMSDSKKEREYFSVRDGYKYFTFDKEDYKIEKHVYNIEQFYVRKNSDTIRISFLKVNIKSKTIPPINVMIENRSDGSWRGTERDGKVKVEFRRFQ